MNNHYTSYLHWETKITPMEDYSPSSNNLENHTITVIQLKY